MNSVTSLKNKKQSRQMLFELFDEEMFGTLPDYLTRIMSPGPATMMLRESMRQATRNIVHRNTELTKGFSKTKTLQEKFNICYELYGKFGYSFQHEVELEDSNRIVIKITNCPHIEFTKKNQSACSICEGIMLGILDEEFRIHLPRIHYEKCMAQGDDYCRYKIVLRESNIF